MATVINKVHHPLYSDLAAIVGRDYVSDDEFVRYTYSRDCSPARGNAQGVVVRPESTEQIVQIVKLANVTRTPIVPSGGRASLYGTPPGMPGKGIVVDMTRVGRMIKIDEVNLTVIAEAGMTTAMLNTLLAEKGWDVHTAAMPWYTDTLGGQVSGYMGGGVGLEMSAAGWNATHIAGVKVVLPDGNVLQTGAGAGNNIINKSIMYDRYPGNPDITGLFIGDGGIFGIKVEATYRMYRFSKFKEAVTYAFDSFEDGWRLCTEVSTIEPLPYFLLDLIIPTNATRMRGMDKYYVFLAVKGNIEKEIEAKLEIIEECAAQLKAHREVSPAVKEWEQNALTPTRYREMGQFASPGVWTWFDFIVSRSQVADCHHTCREYIYDMLDRNNITYYSTESCVPIGSPSWLVDWVIIVPGHDTKAVQVVRDIFYNLTEIAASRGWYPDCHQGYGTQMMAKYWPKSHYDFMRNLKKTLDPNNIMNPGLWDL